MSKINCIKVKANVSGVKVSGASDFMFKRKILLNATSSFFPNKFEKKDKINYNYFEENMKEENLDLDFWFKKADEAGNYFIKEIDQNYLINKQHEKGCLTSKYIKHLLILVCASLSISPFAY